VLSDPLHAGVEIHLRFGVGPAFHGDVSVVKGEEGNAELLDELECRIDLRF
jgi:hypothetical protein